MLEVGFAEAQVVLLKFGAGGHGATTTNPLGSIPVMGLFATYR
jgi:hypothetical protein